MRDSAPPPPPAPCRLFLDLDGVLADFDQGVERVTGRRPPLLSNREMWRALAREADFFATLEMMIGARDLWDYCRPFKPTILTGIPRGAWAAPQKRRWVAAVLGENVEVITCLSAEKHRWSGPGHVLVDDREKQRAAWEGAGGHFILHRTPGESIQALKAAGWDHGVALKS